MTRQALSISPWLLALPGMTQAGLDSVLQELSTIRSEKKAANRVKEMLVAAAGGGDALRVGTDGHCLPQYTFAICLRGFDMRLMTWRAV
jgi:exportin-5